MLTRVDLLENVMFDVTEHATLEGFGDKGKQRDWTIVLHVRFDARLYTGTTFANFHSSGSTPQRRDLLKRAQSEGAIRDEVSVSSRAGIPSGPKALLMFKLAKTVITSSLVSVMSSRIMSGSECSSVMRSLSSS